MSAYDFSRTIVVWVDFERPEFGLVRIGSAIQAYDALHMTRVLNVGKTVAPVMWNAAERAVDIALIDPSRTNLRAAEETLLDLVKRASPISQSVRRRLAPETCSSGPFSPRAIMRAMWPNHRI
ncbi:hypothetical protein G4G93_34865 [Methylobacterium sp. DB0501]|uniref:hypothetical protein n=2 Tax=Methylobacterium TaxID=407 RepID=UPI0013EAB42D|nr:hypothetical protein [Methylobacterium sp. DB0501]NGM39002.1 hypothetical protein [Methylobacterium sp. DB0501]